ncbi:MAG: UMP kinase, partial [Nanoarchaeota archaeon]
YQEAASATTTLAQEDVDWLGIHATRINAHLLRSILRDHAEAKIVTDPSKEVHMRKPILIAAGWKPGWSTDYCATMLATQVGAKSIINLSNIDHVYDKDPRKYKTAKPLLEVSWIAFRNIIPSTWSPGMNTPFDPVAARLAQRNHLEVAIINGAHLGRMQEYIRTGRTVGTIIKEKKKKNQPM